MLSKQCQEGHPVGVADSLPPPSHQSHLPEAGGGGPRRRSIAELSLVNRTSLEPATLTPDVTPHPATCKPPEG
jgi:hypothetical protein